AHMLTQTSAAPDLQGQITELRRIIAALPAPEPAPVPAPAFDPTDLIARLDALESAEPVAPDLSSLTEQLADLSAQIAALQSAQSSVQDSVLAATAGQRDALGAFAADIAQVQADLEDLRALATERVQAAQAARDMALAQAGLDQLRAALVTGAPFAGALAQITEAGFALPDALAGRQGGVATIDALTETFPAAARAGLRASLLDAPATSTTERLGNFLRAQVGAMSTSPRPGDDIDAILSRAGAAMVEGDVAAALAELALLPETARAPMADWIDAATARQNALAALEALAADIAP
ncbi:MAG: COG4223 family protein, partial [Roseinatronobacter sp.]